MKNITKHITGSLAIACLLSGCANVPEWDALWDDDDNMMVEPVDQPPEMEVVNVSSEPEYYEVVEDDDVDQYYRSAGGPDSFGSMGNTPKYANGQGAYNGRMLTKHIGDYVQNMTQDLVSNMEYVSNKTPVGVTHFALIDSDLQRTNLLGYQIAESFMHELHKYRVPVIDYKATDYIRVTDNGDFFLSRDFLELKNKAPIDYILTGTMTRHQGGYLVNARILGLKSKAVVSSAQMLVPFYVVDALLPSDQGMVDGVKLSKG